jgi:nitrite reductase/ring-hydroxylating ferredoxin subunit
MAEHVIGTLAEFPPGSHTVISVGRAQVGIFNVDGTLYALPNICPHQFGPLCSGYVTGTMQSDAEHGWQHYWGLDGQVIACPWHGIEFDITTGQALFSSKLKVRQYRVAIVDDQVLVSL